MASDFGLMDIARVLFQPRGVAPALLSLIPEETLRALAPPTRSVLNKAGAFLSSTL